MMDDARQRTVLVVDDDDDIRANIQDILTDLGYVTQGACDGAVAIELVKQSTFDVALLDFNMPGIDGAELYAQIKALRPEMVAIMLTAHSDHEGIQRALDAGTWQVLPKPVDLAKLLTLVDDASQEPIVLVVDDDRDFCENVWQQLRQSGYRVSLAHSEADGLEREQELSPQLAIIDLRLGGGDGRRVLESILSKRPRTRVILVTGHHEDLAAWAKPLADIGVQTCLKPIDMGVLLSMLGRSNES